MNILRAFLDQNAARLELELGPPDRLTFVVVTPRFLASRHVVFLALLPDRTHPILVAKLPRLREDRSGIDREAAILSAIGSAGAALDSVPRLLALDDSVYPLLLETALGGRPLTQSDIRRRPNECIDAVLAWLAELHALGRRPRLLDRGAFEALLERPLRAFSAAFGAGAPEAALVERTLRVLDSLVEAEVPLLCEHGDLSEPNLVWLDGGKLGVVDWELASLYGLPAQDLGFFLVYAAFSRERAQTLEQQRRAFHEAFIAHTGWARPILVSHLDSLDVDPRLVEPLLVACFARQTSALLDRLVDPGRGGSGHAWIRRNRFYALWEHALDRVA